MHHALVSLKRGTGVLRNAPPAFIALKLSPVNKYRLKDALETINGVSLNQVQLSEFIE